MVPIILVVAAAVGLPSVWVFADDTSEVSQLPASRKVGKMSSEESLAKGRSTRMKPTVLIGSSIPSGVEQLRVHKAIKQGDIVLTIMPSQKAEALAVANYCRENQIYLCFAEFLQRGGVGNRTYSGQYSPGQFYSRADVKEIIDAAGEYFFARITLGEIGGVLYWPKAYTINNRKRAGGFQNLPACETMTEAQAAYVAYCKKWLDYDREKMGPGPLMIVDSSLLSKYQAMAGVDKLCLEVLPGDPHIMHASFRGSARAFDKPWGAHIAMQPYGGVVFDELWEKRWRTSVFYSYIAGADFIYPESGHYWYGNDERGQHYRFASKEMKRVRSVIREAWQFARIHQRPEGGPKTTLGVVHGNGDGTPGLWNRYAWGQYHDDSKWLEGPAERGWRFVDKFHRKESWASESVQGEEDFSGNPPYGQYDVVPIEAPLKVLQQYTCLVFLGWNTMTEEIYRKLKDYVEAGGHLLMYLPQLSTRTDRSKSMKLYRDGDFSDLFGVKIKGKFKTDMRGVNCMADSSLKSYRFPLWRINSDPRFMGNITPARVQNTGARVISGWSVTYRIALEKITSQPMIVENSVGKGKAFLVTAWEYPADEGLRSFTNDLLRVVLQGEQGEIRLLSSDRVRYAVYDGRVGGNGRKYSVIYLLNTDPDCNAQARLWVRGQKTGEFTVPANDLKLAYQCGDAVLLFADKCVDIKTWKVNNGKHVVELFSARPQKVEVHNVGKADLTVSVNGSRISCAPGEKKSLRLEKCVDPRRKEFFAPDFLSEPPVKYRRGRLPY